MFPNRPFDRSQDDFLAATLLCWFHFEPTARFNLTKDASAQPAFVESVVIRIWNWSFNISACHCRCCLYCDADLREVIKKKIGKQAFEFDEFGSSEFGKFRIEFGIEFEIGIGQFEFEFGRQFTCQNFEKFRFQTSGLPISNSLHTPGLDYELNVQ
mgnify:CR=1 FL=1